MHCSFEEWISQVEQAFGVDDIDHESMRVYFEAGLSPSEAVLRDRLHDNVIEN